jgi:hypothetical protein
VRHNAIFALRRSKWDFGVHIAQPLRVPTFCCTCDRKLVEETAVRHNAIFVCARDNPTPALRLDDHPPRTTFCSTGNGTLGRGKLHCAARAG